MNIFRNKDEKSKIKENGQFKHNCWVKLTEQKHWTWWGCNWKEERFKLERYSLWKLSYSHSTLPQKQKKISKVEGLLSKLHIMRFLIFSWKIVVMLKLINGVIPRGKMNSNFFLSPPVLCFCLRYTFFPIHTLQCVSHVTPSD